MRVLIVATDPYNRGALATSRALAAAGWEVGCVSGAYNDLLGASRSISWHHRAPSPIADLEGFVTAIAAALDFRGYSAVLPSSDAETFALSRNRDRLSLSLPYPPHEAVERAFDKLALTQEAASCGIATPWTRPATEAALAAVEWPVVVKARLHWRAGAEGLSSRSPTWVCADQHEASRRVAEVRAAGREPLLQELVRGPLQHSHLLVDRGGGLVAAVQQRSEPATGTPFTWPPGAGVRVRSVTVSVDQELTRKTLVLLRRLGWVGFVGLMFIVDSDGIPRLVDFNGRIPMSFQQSIAACPELPDRWAKVAAGCPAGEALAARTGVRYQWLRGDLLRALQEGRGGRLADLRSCLAYAGGATHGVWSVKDPRPAIRSWQNRVRRLPQRMGMAQRGCRSDTSAIEAS